MSKSQNLLQKQIRYVASTPLRIFALVSVLLLIELQYNATTDLITERGNETAKRIATVTQYGVFSGDVDFIREIIAKEIARNDIELVLIKGSDGEEIAKAGEESLQHRYLHRQFTSAIEVNDNGAIEVVATVIVDIDLAPIYSRYLMALLAALVLLAITNSIATALARRTADRIIGPLMDLKNVVNAIASGKLDARSNVQTKTEIRELEEGVNAMADTIESLRNDMQSQINSAKKELNEAREKEVQERVNQYIAYRSGQLELTSNMIHDIGNAITTVQFRADELSRHRGRIHAIPAAINKIISKDNVNRDELLELLQVVADVIATQSQNDTGNDLEVISKVASHIADIIRLQRKSVRSSHSADRFTLSSLFDDALNIVTVSCQPIRDGLITLDVDGDDIEVELPENPLLQCMVNLIKNSAEAIDANSYQGGGNIRLYATFVDDRTIKISVTDNGEGFSQHEIEEAFNFAFTTKEQGSGSGLNSTARIIESMGGVVSIESEGKGYGATISMRLPISLIEA